MGGTSPRSRAFVILLHMLGYAWEVSRGFQGACLILIRSEEHIRAVVTSMELHDPHPTTCILYVFITERAIRQDQPRENSAGNKSLSGKASGPQN